jgi:LL-diaminopimelate aminotransferase
MIKKVVLDKADRIFNFPFDLEDFFPRRAIKTGERKLPTIDLGHFTWPISPKVSPQTDSPLKMADDESLNRLKNTLAEWLYAEYGVKINARKEIYIGQGIRRIFLDFCLVFVDYGDIVLCPEPGMPFYRRVVIASGGVPVAYPISARTKFGPSLTRLPETLARSAKILILNNPNNPFATILDETRLAELVHFASRQNIFIINDAAYCSFSEERHCPVGSVPGGRKVCLEVFSIPYTFGLPYLPLGFAIGPPELISGLKRISKTTGLCFMETWLPLIKEAVEHYPSPELKSVRRNMDRSRLEAERLAEKMGWEIAGGKSGPFLWVKIPLRRQSGLHASALLRRKRILTLPGTAFGGIGEGYLRLSLTSLPEHYAEANRRISKRLLFRQESEEQE